MSNKTTTVKWKRFSRASYAVFNSLHKELAIGVLSAAMLQSAGLKAAQVHKASCINPADSVPSALADDDNEHGISIGDVEVLGTRVPLIESQAPRMVTVLRAADITAAAVHSINDLLEYAVGVDVRQRGEMGVQTDISVRGGTFDQITLLLNGINISSPHTGHLSADFPVSMDDIERIEVVEGPAARVFGTSAFTGVVNIVTKASHQLPLGGGSSNALSGSLHLRGGEYGYGGGNGRISYSTKSNNTSFTNTLSGGYSRSDGATPNSDFSNTHLFYQGILKSPSLTGGPGWVCSVQAGYSYKPYGANTFYGASSTDQWESNERWMAAIKAEGSIGRLHIAPQFYWNRWNDHYQWHRGVSPGGENYHQVDVLGGAVNAWVDWALGKTSFGIEVRGDGIWSTNLGKKLSEDEYRNTAGHDGTPDRQYTRHDHRTNTSAFLEHDILLDRWTISLGMLANRNSGLDSKWRFYPGVDVAYHATRNVKLFASWNMALRMPTYTDLYYSGSNIEGNSNLKPEKTNDVALGIKLRPVAWDLQAQTFYSHKSDMIDWVVYQDETIGSDGKPTDQKTWTYRSGNFRLDNVGVELQAAFLPRELYSSQFPLRRIGVSYAYISEDISYVRPVVLSKYAQEYLRHKVVVNADGTLLRYRSSALNMSLSWRWQDRVGKGNDPYALLDARLSWDMRHLRIYADCTNLLDKQYFDYSIVPQPGRWLKAGVILTL